MKHQYNISRKKMDELYEVIHEEILKARIKICSDNSLTPNK
jgi:hypothetical protein